MKHDKRDERDDGNDTSNESCKEQEKGRVNQRYVMAKRHENTEKFN